MILGKRKVREADGDDEKPEKPENQQSPYPSSTLFVSNLPYNVTSTDLQTLFSEIAPVRNAFVACEQGTGVSKGVGYVSFTTREDAKAAYDKIAKDGISLVGRSLRVQWADQKSKVKKEKMDVSEKKPKKPRPSQQKTSKPQDPLAIRTIVISGLPDSIDSKALWKKIRKYKGAEKVEWPVTMDDGIQDASTAHTVFSTPATAQDAVTKLHAHVFKGSLLSVTLKKRLDTLSSNKLSTLSTSTPSPAPSHANRLIVRNLPFTATAQDLRSIFLPYGPIYSINMPLKETTTMSDSPKKDVKTEEHESEMIIRSSKAPSQLNKGFAFVWFYARKDAEHAMEKCNGMLLRAGAAEALVEGKQKRKKERRMEKKLAALDTARENRQEKEGGDEAAVKVEENDEVPDEEERDRSNKNERVIAVDWALSKNRWEEEKARIEEEAKKASDDEGDASDSDSGSEEGSGPGEEDGFGVHEDSSDSEGGSGEESDNEEDESPNEGEHNEGDNPTRPQLPQTDIGTTLFIRNVPYDTTEDELRTLFRSFGPLRYARITTDPSTGRSRGTAFACFWNREDADKVIQQSELLRDETTGGSAISAPQKKNPFSLPSILTPDPSSSLAQNLVLHGRALDVVRAVTRDEAGKLKEEGERAREKADKRNMYLLREGVILPNSPQASSISPADLDRRTKSYNARRTLLKSNPSLYISKTRLSIRQIPIHVTDRMLKRLALHAVRAFETEVKLGKRPDLSTEELADPGARPPSQEDKPNTERTIEDGNGNESDVSTNIDNAPHLSQNAKRKAKHFRKLAQRKGTGVKQAKIIRQAERIDPITGKGRSRGYGFVEMYTHADALRVLRWTNNNVIHSLLQDWWIEELEWLIKVERGKMKEQVNMAGEDEKGGARLKRMMGELEKELKRRQGGEEAGGKVDDEGKDEEKGTRKNRGTLIVEFSIENVQVVQRRDAIQKDKAAHRQGDDGAMMGKKMLDDGVQNPRRQSISAESDSLRIPKSKPKRAYDDSQSGAKGKLRPEKKRRTTAPLSNDVSLELKDPVMPRQSKESEASMGSPRPGHKIGSIIGRKRKERKERKVRNK